MNAEINVKENDEKDGQVVTMVDVLAEENELEEDANAVLGGADDKICTYSKGHVFRQPLYACATCNPPDTGKTGGVCLACSYRCHEGHELIELYTKRNFRCDCGNSCFENTKCNLEPVKDEVNVNNTYNQNFLGTYCTCKRPYPDPEDTVEDEMLQCIICEDWFHKRHLKAEKIPAIYDEIICHECMEKHPFIWKYTDHCIGGVETCHESLNTPVIDIVNNDCDELPNDQNKEADQKSENECKLKKSNISKVSKNASTFWPDGWRKHLCKCEQCIKMYESEKISFLLNETDTVQFYENKNKEIAKESQYERGLKALSSLNHVQQVEAIEGYNAMKAELMGYLQKFAESRKVVRAEDIQEFFTQMQAKKKPKVEVPYYCH